MLSDEAFFLRQEDEAALCSNSDTSCILGKERACSGEECGSMVPALIFPFMAISFGLILQPIANRIRAPYTSLLLVAGCLLGTLGCSVQMGLLTESLQLWAHISPPSLFFYVFLAPLVFQAAFEADAHVFAKYLGQILFLAFVVVALQVFIIAAFQLYVIRSPEWTLMSALVFGSMLSATDPISVTATLSQLGVSEQLGVLIEGESLLNDGSAVVFFEAFLEGAVGHETSAGGVIVQLLRLSLGGFAMGIAFALVATIFLSSVYEMFEVEVSMTLVVAFLGFWTAQSPSILSGVICNVTAGVLLGAYGKQLISPSVRDPLHRFWGLVSWIANTIVFVYAGLLVVGYIWSCAGDPLEWYDYVHILTWYAWIHVVRFGLVFLFHPIMRINNKSYTWKHALVLAYSGLRGSVTLILALEIGDTAEIPVSVRSRVVVWSAALVGLTLFVNGTTIKSVLKLLRLDRPDPVKEEFLWRARAAMLSRTYEILDVMAIDGNTKLCSWSSVAQAVIPRPWVADIHRVNRVISHSLDLRRESVLTTYRPSPENHRGVGGGGRMSLAGSGAGRHSMERASIDLAMLQHRSRRTSAVGSTVKYMTDEELSTEGDKHAQYRTTSSQDYIRHRQISMSMDRWDSRNTSDLPDLENFNTDTINYRHELGEELDIEVRRRMLTSLLSILREAYESEVVTYVTLSSLTDDLKNAIDANEEGEVYDLFRTLLENPHKLPISEWLNRAINYVSDKMEGLLLRVFNTSRNQALINLALMMSSALKRVLNESFLQQSEIVLSEVKTIYEFVTAFLSTLEAAAPAEFARVQTRTVVQFVLRRQTQTLEKMRMDGEVNKEECDILHEETIEIQRNFFLRTSRDKRKFYEAANAAEMLRGMPVFRRLEEDVYEKLVKRAGKMIKLKKNEVLKVKEDSVVIVVDGALRVKKSSACLVGGMGEKVTLPSSWTEYSEHKHDVPQPGQCAGLEPSDSLPMHACFGRYSILLPLDFLSGKPSSLPYVSSCHVYGGATVFVLPNKVARELAVTYEWVRAELARHIVRIIMFSFMAMKGNWVHNFANTEEDESPVNVATHILQTLPYSSLVGLTKKHGKAKVHGPGVLLQGRLRVSRRDVHAFFSDADPDATSTQVFSAPSILPSGLLSLELLSSDDVEGSDDLDLAEIIVQDIATPEVIAEDRIRRWNAPPDLVEANGRFGLYKHYEVPGITDVEGDGDSHPHEGSDGETEDRPSQRETDRMIDRIGTQLGAAAASQISHIHAASESSRVVDTKAIEEEAEEGKQSEVEMGEDRPKED